MDSLRVLSWSSNICVSEKWRAWSSTLPRESITEFVIFRIANRGIHHGGVELERVKRALSIDFICCWVDIGGGKP